MGIIKTKFKIIITYRQREREKEGMDSERSTSNVPNK